ncbi:class I lanthipeptide [Spirosoma soli]|uniref:Class I lanthipeptide n=1 Tax=Spirosoma soli TaxID=1770529 RepID=A0ABW5M8D6_9BACT
MKLTINKKSIAKLAPAQLSTVGGGAAATPQDRLIFPSGCVCQTGESCGIHCNSF